jgi:hypothetical protein
MWADTGYNGRGDPVVEAVAVQVGEDLGELGNVAGERVEVPAALAGRWLPWSESARRQLVSPH